MPVRPTPLITKGHGILIGASKSPFSPLPSELPRTPILGHFDAIKSHDEAMKTPITPPTAYTEFLKNTANSPALSLSPHSLGLPYSPASSTSASATTQYRHGYYTPATPYPPSATKRRSLRLPPSPASANSSPNTESPRSRSRSRSVSSSADDDSSSSSSHDDDDDEDDDNDEIAAADDRVMVKQVVTTTVTYTAPRMSLMPAPKGKRRRIA